MVNVCGKCKEAKEKRNENAKDAVIWLNTRQIHLCRMGNTIGPECIGAVIRLSRLGMSIVNLDWIKKYFATRSASGR